MELVDFLPEQKRRINVFIPESLVKDVDRVRKPMKLKLSDIISAGLEKFLDEAQKKAGTSRANCPDGGLHGTKQYDGRQQSFL